ncbi:MAG TPA: S-layer homology domain-containing protein [Bryobacteraceae bacterium]|nr:S-layer homology domain-containing protein [Bryobacteraceae bacterium]
MFPALAPTDPRNFHYGNIAGQALLACKGQEPGVNASVAAFPGLFDIRCGEDAYDTAQAYRHPVTGAFTPADFRIDIQPVNFPQQIVPFGIRGGAATDPNNLGLWLYGAYAKGRLSSINGFGVWGTYLAHYPLTFPIRDPYNNTLASYSDVQPGHPFFIYIQIAKHTEIEPGSRTSSTFNPNGAVARAEMTRWTIRSQMNEAAITAYINSTGGFFCSFADICPAAAPASAVTDTNPSGDWRYVEVMYRRGYTKGCETTNDGQRRFCPARTLTRGEMSVFVIRAKMNSVFPTVASGAFTTTSCQPPGTQAVNVGDQFGLFVGCSPYFSDVPNTHIYYSFIQKMRELRISNGTSYSTPSALGTYSPDQTLTRGELMTFLVRAFFP